MLKPPKKDKSDFDKWLDEITKFNKPIKKVQPVYTEWTIINPMLPDGYKRGEVDG